MLDSVVARPAVQPVDEVRSAVERYRDAVDRHDIDAAVAAFTDDGLIDCTPAPDGNGTRVPPRSGRCSGSSSTPRRNVPSRPRN